MKTDMSSTKQTVLITGTSSGFGKSCARYFATQGWNVIAIMRQPETEKELQLIPDTLVTKLDVTDRTSILNAIEMGSMEDPADVTLALSEAFQHDGPALIDVVVNRMEPFMPPTIKLEPAIGFNPWAIKAVSSGRGNELVDLAASNLIR
ncbi:MAG TPA: SDR family NAD(P)-dependent oxidoreductase [Verrucomicrobiae bacterium]|nr:SDR family NAD(P)-dependent oxidoreductase [Verrucomicrobiae bacterium]